jgi:CRISPR-associated protein Cas6
MTQVAAEMIDAVYDVSGGTLPVDYAFPLWEALLQHAPALGTDEMVGVIPLRTSVSDEGMLLPKRAKLTVRLPAALAEHSSSLSGRQLDMNGRTLQLGAGKLRPIQAFTTLHAHLVASSDENEERFLEGVLARLAELNIAGKLICGLHNVMTAPDRTIHGYSLVIHDLKPEASLRLQYIGLGADRRFGCGIFVPYKTISDLD